MKRKICTIIVLLVSFSCDLWAQISDSVLIDYYGKIRADMVRDVCQFVGFQSESSLGTISNASLKDFKKTIANNDTLKKIINEAKALDGTDITKYQDNVRKTRTAFRDKLVFYYPNRESEVESIFLKYVDIIDKLTEECQTFKNNRENYLSQYPNGHFSQYFDVAEKGDKTDRTKDKSGIINTPEHKETKTNKSESSSNAGSFMKGMLLGVVLLSVLYFYLKKRKRKVSKNKKQTINNHSEVIIDNNPSQEQSAIALPQENLNNKLLPSSTDQSEERSENKEISESMQQQVPIEEQQNKVVENLSGDTKPPIKEDVVIKIPPKDFGQKGMCMAMDAGEWIVVGASVQGNGHISMNMPCQDHHGYEYLGDGWGIAITSDGAGSAKLSHIGSAATVSRAMVHFKELIEKEGWKTNSVLPSDSEWMKKSYKVLKRVRDELEALSNKNKCDIKDLSATIITIIHSPLGLLIAHIGDGRAGYKDMSGEWHSVLTPHKGEEANQTIFIPSDFWNIPFYEMSGATVPESKVVKDEIAAFTLMSDGCENTSWLCNQYNETVGKYFDPNVPHKKFFDPLLDTLQSFRANNVSIEERAEKWYSFIKEGNKSFERETDDKTMILGALYM